MGVKDGNGSVPDIEDAAKESGLNDPIGEGSRDKRAKAGDGTFDDGVVSNVVRNVQFGAPNLNNGIGSQTGMLSTKLPKLEL